MGNQKIMTIIASIAMMIMLSMILLLIRAIIGSSFFDRVLAVSLLGTMICAFIAIWSVFSSDPAMIDVMIMCLIVNFVTIIACITFANGRKARGNRDG